MPTQPLAIEQAICCGYLSENTDEGHLYLYQLNDYIDDYNKDRLLDKYNENKEKIKERETVETQDAEELMNDFDIELEQQFDVYLNTHKNDFVSFDANDKTQPQSQTSFHLKQNKQLQYKCKPIECDLLDSVSPNTCLLKIRLVQITSNIQKNFLFQGTYDGMLYSSYLDIITEGQSEELVLQKYKQWSFPFPLTSILTFDYFNALHDDQMQTKNLRDSFKKTKNQSSTKSSFFTQPKEKKISPQGNNFLGTNDNSVKNQKLWNSTNKRQPSGQHRRLGSSKTQSAGQYNKYAFGNKQNQKSGIPNDTLIIVGLTNNSMVPFSLATTKQSDLENSDSKMKKIAQIQTSKDQISEYSKPILAYIERDVKQSQISKIQTWDFCAITNDGFFSIFQCCNSKLHKSAAQQHQQLIIQDNFNIELKESQLQLNTYGASTCLFSIQGPDPNHSSSIMIEIIDIHQTFQFEQNINVLCGLNGKIIFQINKISEEAQKLLSEEQISFIPEVLKFDLEFRIKKALVKKVRLHGDAPNSTQCLLVFTYLDFMMAFYDFKLEVNIKHISAKNKLSKINSPLGKKNDLRKIKNPYTPYLSNLQTVKSPERQAVIDDIEIDERTSPSSYKFFGKRHYVDPRILMVEDRAEIEYYEKKKQELELQKYYAKKQYEKKVLDRLDQQQRDDEQLAQIQQLMGSSQNFSNQGISNPMRRDGEKHVNFYDSLNERESAFNTLNPNQQLHGGQNYNQGAQIQGQQAYQLGEQKQNLGETGGQLRPYSHLYTLQGNQQDIRERTNQNPIIPYQQSIGYQNPYQDGKGLSNQMGQSGNFNQTQRFQQYQNPVGQNTTNNPTNMGQSLQNWQSSGDDQYKNQYNDVIMRSSIRTQGKFGTLYGSKASSTMKERKPGQLHLRAQSPSRHSVCKEVALPPADKMFGTQSSLGLRDTFQSSSSSPNKFQEVDQLILQAKSLLFKKQNQKAKDILEKSINQFGVEHADVYYLCGEANRRLGINLVAEQMLLRALSFEFHSPFVYSSLGYVYRDLGQLDKSCQLFKRALEQQHSPQIAFELGKILASMNYLTESMGYFTEAIDSAEAGLQSEVGSILLTEFYMHRSCVYEALGLIELSKKDQLRILELDPQIQLKYYQEIKKLDGQGKYTESKRVKEFLYKLNELDKFQL